MYDDYADSGCKQRRHARRDFRPEWRDADYSAHFVAGSVRV